MRKDKMGRFLEWWKAPGRYWENVPESGHAGAGNPGENGSEERKRSGEKRYVTLLKSLLLAALPLLCCLVHCIGQGQSLGKVYIPSSGWNDELFYYKQVESILEYGYPQGYFGFNESHALKLSFAAWSPVLVFPWILWGLVFGWNLMSPVICNIFLMSLCCFLFVWLVRPTWKQMGILTLLFCLYRPFVRYMLSGMAEVICFAILILFYSMAINYLRRERNYKLVLLFLVSGLMVLMRPYMALFMLLPVYFWMRRGRSRAGKLCRGAAGAAVLAAVLGIYAVINHYLGAEYFTPLFYTDWIQAFFDRGIFGGGYYTVRKIYYVGQDFLEHVRASFGSGLSADACFVCYLVCMAVLAAQGFRDWRRVRRLRAGEALEDRAETATVSAERKRAARQGAAGESRLVWEKMVIEIHLAFSFIAMLFALLLMYKLTEGSRHLMIFLAAAVFVIAWMDTVFYKKAVLVGVTFAYFFAYITLNPFDYQVPFREEGKAAAVENWRQEMASALALREEDAPNYDNVVIWVYSDLVDGETVITPYQLLYGLPKGFGISCCMREYVMPDITALQSRYIAVPANGEIAMLCQGQGCRLIYGDEELVLYELRGD